MGMVSDAAEFREAVIAQLAGVWLPMVVASALTLVLALLVVRGRKREETMYPVIIGLATGNPPYRCTQKQALAIAQKVPGCESVKPVLERIYGNSRIASRYFAVPDFTPDVASPDDPLFYPADGSFQVPVSARLDKFRECAVPLVCSVARRAIMEAGLHPEDLDKLVVVSSTGFLGPGLDCEIIKRLRMKRSVDRSLIGFMGCAAAMNGFRIANDYVRCHPGKFALMLCVELSSVHTTFEDNINDAILHAIFADGCAACVLSGETASSAAKGTLAIVDDHAELMEGTEDGITLDINPNGISCTLSKHLPSYIAKHMGGYVDSWLRKHALSRGDVDFWAVHPGGRRIIEEAQNGLGLTEDQTADSWAVLNEYGNMLSPSVMYVLSRVFARHQAALAAGKPGYAMGLAFSFSPALAQRASCCVASTRGASPPAPPHPLL
ncbi:polyketide synthase III [Tribonema minus]|uniref:Polyketide synthase III n=1 Tax=Tribonema minus TaxID=303371 RepID=A0A836CMD8_9STRA|nr:polyketide synthase III [Tribonema minus]